MTCIELKTDLVHGFSNTSFFCFCMPATHPKKSFIFEAKGIRTIYIDIVFFVEQSGFFQRKQCLHGFFLTIQLPFKNENLFLT